MVLGFWGFRVLRDFRVLMSCGFRVSRLWSFTVLGFQGYGVLRF